MAATESTSRIRWEFGGLPSLSSRPASAPMATIVPIVSKKSASIRVKTSSAAATNADLAERAEQAELAEQPEVGDLDHAARPGRDVEAPAGRVDHLAGGVGLAADLEDRLDDDREDGGADDADEDGALHLRTMHGDDREQADDEDEHRPADEDAADAELDRYRTGCRACATKPASTRPMKVMNRPMPTEIAVFSCGRHRAEHRLPEPGQHQDRMMMPSMTTRPIASAQVMPAARRCRTRRTR